ncbi:MAG TPA: sulfur carrier protein ThiS [Pyrinomonadaceae bacterium]|nr:sulfur carrier protein ThiS [Pyrinomonadaceae bacterium]
MKIQLNGESREFADALTVESLVSELDLEPTRVAIEVNLNVVRRNDWATTSLSDGDRVEIVQFVGGGGE